MKGFTVTIVRLTTLCQLLIGKDQKKTNGFTLIEILLVFSIIAIISVASIFAYSSYNTKQQINNSSQDLLVLVHTAKAKAQAQISPSTCTSLQSYQVMRCGAGPSCQTVGANATTYELQAVCNNGIVAVDTKALAPNVTFTNGSSTTVSFNVLTGGASGGTFTITNGTTTRTVTVSSYGQVGLSGN